MRINWKKELDGGIVTYRYINWTILEITGPAYGLYHGTELLCRCNTIKDCKAIVRTLRTRSFKLY